MQVELTKQSFRVNALRGKPRAPMHLSRRRQAGDVADLLNKDL